MHHEGDRTGQDRQVFDIERSIQPSAAVPPTVLVTELDNGALMLQGRSNQDDAR